MVTGKSTAQGLRVTLPKGTKYQVSESATAKDITVQVVASDNRYYEFKVGWIEDEAKTNKGSFAVSGRNAS